MAFFDGANHISSQASSLRTAKVEFPGEIALEDAWRSQIAGRASQPKPPTSTPIHGHMVAIPAAHGRMVARTESPHFAGTMLAGIMDKDQ